MEPTHEAFTTSYSPTQTFMAHGISRSRSHSRLAARNKARYQILFPKFFKTLLPWSWELLCTTLMLACLMALVIVLKIYDGRPLSEWNAAISMGNASIEISINTVVSVLGAISKGLLAVAVTSSLSQSKWIWFAGQKQPLLDFQRFDDAAQDLLGSLRLLLRTRLR